MSVVEDSKTLLSLELGAGMSVDVSVIFKIEIDLIGQQNSQSSKKPTRYYLRYIAAIVTGELDIGC